MLGLSAVDTASAVLEALLLRPSPATSAAGRPGPPAPEGTHGGLGKNNKLGALSDSGIHAGDDVGQILHCVHT